MVLCKQEIQKEAEARKAKLRAAEEAKRAEEERIAAEKRKTSPATHDRHADENNLAFKCNFCDGGCFFLFFLKFIGNTSMVVLYT